MRLQNRLYIFQSDHIFIAFTYFILRKVVGFFIRLFFVKLVHGLQNIPLRGSSIIVFNHQSYMDFLCFASVAPRNIHFLSAEKFFDHKLWRILMVLTGQIKVDRFLHDKSISYKAVSDHISKGKIIGIFPEGTRSPHENFMLKFYNGAIKFALHHRVSVIPVGIVGTFAIWPKHIKFPKIKKIVEINIGKPMMFFEHYGKQDDNELCSNIMKKVIREIELLSGKKYQHYENK